LLAHGTNDTHVRAHGARAFASWLRKASVTWARRTTVDEHGQQQAPRRTGGRPRAGCRRDQLARAATARRDRGATRPGGTRVALPRTRARSLHRLNVNVSGTTADWSARTTWRTCCCRPPLAGSHSEPSPADRRHLRCPPECGGTVGGCDAQIHPHRPRKEMGRLPDARRVPDP
jgi:hypothetical protein